MKNARRVTEWLDENELIRTNDGLVPAGQWLQSEVERISGDGSDAGIASRKTKTGTTVFCLMRPIGETSIFSPPGV